jgi:hypothetical protein
MKETRKRSAWLIRESLVGAVLLLAAGCATEAPVAHDGVLSAKVVRVKGGARSFTRAGVWQPLKVGDLVTPGTLLQTAANSRMDLVLGAELPAYQPGAAQNTLQIEDNSLISIDKLALTKSGADVATDTELDLKSGQIHGVVNKLSAGSKYEVRIPNGVAGIREAVYDITAKGDVKVRSGSVVFAYAEPGGKVVTQVVTGSQPSDARTVLRRPPPSLGTPPPVSRPF